MAKSAKTAGPDSFAKRLKAASGAWGKAKEAAAAAGSGPTEFEDGRYMARLVKAGLGESAAGRLQVIFHFKFEDDDTPGVPNYGGQVKYDYQGIESEQNMTFFARRIDQLGYEVPDDLTGITDILADIEKEKPLCKIRLKSKGDFQNVYIDKVYGANEETEEDEDADEGDATEEEETVEEEAPVKPKKGKKDKTPAPAEEEEDDDAEDGDDEEEEEEEEADDEEEDGVELTVGMVVMGETSSGTRKGTVLEIKNDEGIARVKMDDNGKVAKIALDKLSIPDEVPEEPVKTKKSKK